MLYDEYEALLRKYGGGAGATPSPAQQPEQPAFFDEYQSLLRRYGGGTVKTSPGSGAFPPPEPPGPAGGLTTGPPAPSPAQLVRGRMEEFKLSAPVDTTQWTPEQGKQWADLSILLKEAASKERESGERMPLWEQAAGKLMNAASLVVPKIPDLGPSPAGEAFMLAKAGLTPEQVEAASGPLDVPEPITAGEDITQGVGSLAGLLGIGLATAPLSAEGAAMAGARGAGPIAREAIGQLVQEIPFAVAAGGRVASGELDPLTAVAQTIAGPVVGTLLGRPGSRAIVSPDDALPARVAESAPDVVRVYRGSGGPRAGGAGGDFFSTNPQRAASYGPNVEEVDIPRDVFDAGRTAARQAGSATEGDVVLPNEYVKQVRPSEGIEPDVIDLGDISREVDLQAEARRLGGEPPLVPPVERQAAPGATAGPQGEAKGVIGGGQAFQPMPNPLPKYINENLNTERVEVEKSVLEDIYTTGRVHGLDIKVARGPKRPFEQVEREAMDLLNNTKARGALLNKPLGEAYTDVEGFALRQIHIAQNRLAADVGERYSSGTATFDEFKQAIDGVLTLEEKRASMAAEMGRGLSAMRMIANGEGISPEALKKLSAHIASTGGDPTAVRNLIKQVRTGNIGDKLYEWWINALVSGSHGVNAVSNAGKYALDATERYVAAAIDTPLSKLPGRTKEVYFREAAELSKLHGLSDGLNAAWKYLKTGVGTSPARHKVPATGALTGPASAIKYIGTRPLGAMDEVFSMLAYTGEARAHAVRTALGKGLSGDALQKEVARLSDNLSTYRSGGRLSKADQAIAGDMFESSTKHAKQATFTDDNWLGRLGGKFAGLSVDIRGKTFQPFRWVVPFTGVGSSIITQAVERTPVGFATAIKGEGPLASRLAKPTVGTLLGLTAWWMREKGILTGDERPDTNERTTLGMTGWQPNSIRLGDKYVDISRYEPVGTIMIMSNNAIEAFERGDDESGNRIVQGLTRIVNNIGDDTWFRGISDIVEAVDSNSVGQAANKLLARQVAGFVPNVLRRVGKEIDPTTRQTQGFFDTLAREAGVQLAEPRLDPYGREQGGDRPILDRMARIAGVPTSTSKQDDLVRERLRLGSALGEVGLAQSQGEEQLFKDAKPSDVTKFRAAKGSFLREIDQQIISSEKYKRANDNQRKTMLERGRSAGGSAFNDAWRKGGKRFDGLDRLNLRPQQIAKKAQQLKKKTRLSETDFERFQGEFPEEEFNSLKSLLELQDERR